MKVIALKQHSPDGSKHYQPGDVYELSESSARILAAMGFVRIESEAQKRIYKRRDMKAER